MKVSARFFLLLSLALAGCIRHPVDAPLPETPIESAPHSSPAPSDVPADAYDDIDTIEI